MNLFVPWQFFLSETVTVMIHRQIMSSSNLLLVTRRGNVWNILNGHLVRFIHSKMTLLSMRSHNSVNRAPAWCSGGCGFNSCHVSDFSFFFVLHSCHVMYICYLTSRRSLWKKKNCAQGLEYGLMPIRPYSRLAGQYF